MHCMIFTLPAMYLVCMSKTRSHSRMLHLFPLHPDAQEHVLGPTHLPLFMHIGSQTPGTHLFTHYHIYFHHILNCELSLIFTHSFDTFFLCSLQGRSIRCSSYTDLHSYKEDCKQLKNTTILTSDGTRRHYAQTCKH